MSGTIPTKAGDVLILSAQTKATTYAVGLISEDGQQNFQGDMPGASLKHVKRFDEAKATARGMVHPDRIIYVRDDDSGKWDKVA